MIDELKNKVNTWIKNNKMSPFPVVDTGIIKDGIKLILIIMEESNKKKEYNDIPVHYCNNCLDLKVVELPESNINYCMMCGDTDIKTAHIKEWEEKYEKMYGKRFIERNRDNKPM